MFYKKEREFQYKPGIEKIIEDVVGGGTIDRAGLGSLLFGGVRLDELPPLVIVGKKDNGAYAPLKTAAIQAVAEETATKYKVKKNHLFAVGDFVTVGGKLDKASDKITAIDKSNASYDELTLAATIGAANVGDVLVQVKDKQASGSAVAMFGGEHVVTMNKVDLTVANQQSGLLIRGTIIESVMPFPIDADLKKLLPGIRFV